MRKVARTFRGRAHSSNRQDSEEHRRGISLGKAASDLLRRSVAQPHRTKEINGLTVFDLPADSPPVTSERVRRPESES